MYRDQLPLLIGGFEVIPLLDLRAIIGGSTSAPDIEHFAAQLRYNLVAGAVYGGQLPLRNLRTIIGSYRSAPDIEHIADELRSSLIAGAVHEDQLPLLAIASHVIRLLDRGAVTSCSRSGLDVEYLAVESRLDLDIGGVNGDQLPLLIRAAGRIPLLDQDAIITASRTMGFEHFVAKSRQDGVKAIGDAHLLENCRKRFEPDPAGRKIAVRMHLECVGS